MITYEQIKQANENVNRITFRGSEYALVASRIQEFRAICPNGSIVTDYALSDTQKGMRCIFTASVYDGETLLSTGHAEEIEGRGQICVTSFLEVCETSAVGRALAFLGLGSKESIASAEEMIAAIDGQNKERTKDQFKNSKQDRDTLLNLIYSAGHGLCGKDNEEESEIFTRKYAEAVAKNSNCPVTDIEEMSVDQLKGIFKIFKTRLEKKNEQDSSKG